MTGVPGNPNLYYFGIVGGGVWRTKDAGQSYENIIDKYFGGTIGAVAVVGSNIKHSQQELEATLRD